MLTLRGYIFHLWAVSSCTSAAISAGLPPPGAVSVPASTNTPGMIVSSNFPQIVLLSFDDAVTAERYDAVQPLLNGFANPDGSPIRATFFVNTYNNNFRYTHRLWASQHEIGVHTMSHDTAVSNGIDRARWRREIIGARRILADYAGIPDGDIVGFRAPYLQYQPEMFHVLEDEEFLYDASIPEYINATSTSRSVGARIFPYTLDGTFPQRVIDPSMAPTGSHSGLFEVPLNPLYTGGTAVVLMDSPSLTNHDEFAAALESTFEQHYNGNRAPVTVGLHAKNLIELPGRIPMLTNFIGWALSHSNTWFVTSAEMVDLVKAPTDAASVLTNGIFAAPSRTLLSSNLFSTCNALFPRLTLLGDCPDYYPRWDNFGIQVVDETGDAYATYRYTSDGSTNLIAYSFVVSNSTPYDIASWQVHFDLLNASNRAVYGADSVTQTSESGWEVEATWYLLDLPPGAVDTNLHMLVDQPGETAGITNIVVTLRTLQRVQTEILAMEPEGDSFRLSWFPNAFDYSIYTADTLRGSAWTEAAVEIATNSWSPGNGDGSPIFFMIRAHP